MSDLKTMRQELRRIGSEFGCFDEIEEVLQDYSYREGYERQAPKVHPPVTAAKRDEIKRCAAANPEASQQEIASMVSGVNQGRVSETLKGKYDDL